MAGTTCRKEFARADPTPVLPGRAALPTGGAGGRAPPHGARLRKALSDARCPWSARVVREACSVPARRPCTLRRPARYGGCAPGRLEHDGAPAPPACSSRPHGEPGCDAASVSVMRGRRQSRSIDCDHGRPATVPTSRAHPSHPHLRVADNNPTTAAYPRRTCEETGRRAAACQPPAAHPANRRARRAFSTAGNSAPQGVSSCRAPSDPPGPSVRASAGRPCLNSLPGRSPGAARRRPARLDTLARRSFVGVGFFTTGRSPHVADNPRNRASQSASITARRSDPAARDGAPSRPPIPQAPVAQPDRAFPS